MTKVKISDVVLADDINIRQELRPDAVERYMEIFDDLPPVQLMKPNGKLLLVDGWHRIMAATGLGRTEIEAEIHEGDRTEAIVAAIIANTKHGVPLSTQERNTGIVRLAEAGWSQRRIAHELGLSASQVQRIIETAPVPVHLAHREEVIRAPREYRLPIAEAATAGAWSQRETREIATQLADPLIPDEEKRQIVKDRMTVVDGQSAIDASLVSEFLKRAKERSAGGAIMAFINAAADLNRRLKVDKDPLATFRERDLKDIREGLEEAELVVAKLRGLL